MIETIEVKNRDVLGSWKVRKLRAAGQIPAILYGHGEANIPLSVSRETVAKLLKHGSKQARAKSKRYKFRVKKPYSLRLFLYSFICRTQVALSL